jgi:hypothetical protein
MYEFEYLNDNEVDNLFLNKQKKIEKLNKFNNSYQISVFDKNKRKHVKLNIFASGTQGTIIRDALTGHKCDDFLVGSRYEDLFFKVSICTGKCGNKDPFTLFFNSPEEYERYMFHELSPEVKVRWLNKKKSLENH